MTDALPPTPPLGAKRVNLRLTINQHAAPDIIRGNIELSALRPVAALKIYTEILKRVAPRHPVAFLNRSLCYLLLGYPSLAVFDAHRALLGGLWALENASSTRTLARQIAAYGHHVGEAINNDPASLTALCRFVGGGAIKWLNTDLAMLIIEPRPLGAKNEKTDTQFANDVVMKAYWRLAYSLWKCGAGAMRTALEVLADARRDCFRIWDDYFAAFTDLENRIMTESLQSWERSGTKGLWSTRYTKIRRELYPWDQFSLTAKNVSKSLQDLNLEFRGVLQSCQIKAVFEDGRAIKPRLFAKDDFNIPASARLCDEKSSLHVTSADSTSDCPFCSSCGAALTGPIERFKALNLTHLNGFKYCKWCNDTVYCSPACRELADRRHVHSCDTGLDRYLCNSVLEHEWRGVPEAHVQRLLRLMMLRVITTQRATQEHPLNIPWAKLLDGNLDSARELPDERQGHTLDYLAEPDTPDAAALFPEASFHNTTPSATQASSLIPWSYEANVRHPIHILFTLGGPELALDIINYDGWVLNTLAAKLEAAMRVTRAPRFEKFYDDDGKLIGQRVAAATARAGDGEEVWIGSIHQLATLIDVAGPGQRANTRVYERDGTIVAFAEPNEPDLNSPVAAQEKARLDSAINVSSPSQRSSAPSLAAHTTAPRDPDTEMLDLESSAAKAPSQPSRAANDPAIAISAGEQLFRDNIIHPLVAVDDLPPDWVPKPPRPPPHKDQLTRITRNEGDSMLDAAFTEWSGDDGGGMEEEGNSDDDQDTKAARAGGGFASWAF